jgi:hypothetical protein
MGEDKEPAIGLGLILEPKAGVNSSLALQRFGNKESRHVSGVSGRSWEACKIILIDIKLFSGGKSWCVWQVHQHWNPVICSTLASE